MTTHDLAGVWMHPTGTRHEFVFDGSGWRSYSYMTKKGHVPVAEHEFDTAEQVRNAIQGLEAQGHLRADREPVQPLTGRQDAARQWRSLGEWIDRIFRIR